MTSVETERLATFLRAHGAEVHDALELFGKAKGERGVFATENIEQGELLLRLPASAVITACDNSDDVCGWMPAAVREASPVLRTALFLMHEVAIGEASEWAPYIASLPTSYDTLDQWTQAELAALTGTSVHDELSGLRDASGDLVGPARVLWEKSIAPMIAAAPHLWPNASLSAFLDACAAVRTRGFFDAAAGGGGPYLLPAIDMLNHSRKRITTTLVVERCAPSGTASAAHEGGAGRSSASAVADRGASSPLPAGSALVFSMEAERSISAGEELLHVYDHLDDAQLLLTYGFVSGKGEGSLPATARLPLQSLVDACAARAVCVADREGSSREGSTLGLPWDASDGWESKVAACTRLLAPHKGVVGVSTREPLPDALVTVALLLLIPREDFEELLAADDDDDDSNDDEQQKQQPEQQQQSEQVAAVAAGSAPRRVPMLDSSTLEGEPLLAAAVVEAIVAAVRAAEQRYPSEVHAASRQRLEDGETGPSRSPPCAERRLLAARALCDAEREALAATRHAALRLLCTVGLKDSDDDEEDEDEEEEEEEEKEGQDEDEVEGEPMDRMEDTQEQVRCDAHHVRPELASTRKKPRL